ncbi:MAG: leucyl aminopeptidase family protein [Hyphomicrobiales bacterium]|nr:leucyl aminopeptidase family protein [Hyphomicrobiales bacterium]
MLPIFAPPSPKAIPVWFVTTSSLAEVLAKLPGAIARQAGFAGFKAKPGQHLLAHDGEGVPLAVMFGLDQAGRNADAFLPGRLATLLPPGTYAFANAPHDTGLAALAWLLGSYRFTRYRPDTSEQVLLCAPGGVDAAALEREAAATCRTRDLINTPANDMTPAALAQAARNLASTHGADIKVITGDELLAQNLPLIHAVGRAAHQPPRLVDVTWGRVDAPKVTLVGKGVCFDTGGLNIKPDAGMLLMKKDMGGAAAALAAASLIMGQGNDVRLRLLLPIVENAISGPSFRPGDIYPSRKGLSVEIGNTDAEGRLILADALALADEEAPDLLIDFATLTGAARVALGPDLPPFYTHDEALAAEIAETGAAIQDPVWRLPLWHPYDRLLEGKISDLNNVTSGGFAGSITAALFLNRFVEKCRAYAHFDIYGWTPAARPGRPEGGECQAARLVAHVVARRFGATGAKSLS